MKRKITRLARGLKWAGLTANGLLDESAGHCSASIPARARVPKPLPINRNICRRLRVFIQCSLGMEGHFNESRRFKPVFQLFSIQVHEFVCTQDHLTVPMKREIDL